MRRDVLAVCAWLTICACGSGQTTAAAGTPKHSGGSTVAKPTAVTPDAGAVAVDPAPADDPPQADKPQPPPPDEPAVEVKLDLVDTVKTNKSRAYFATLVSKTAKAAYEKKDYPKAIVYYQALVVALGPASKEARDLADLWALAGQNEQAVAVLDAYIAASSDPDQISEAQAAAKRIGGVNQVFSKQLKLPSQTKDATKIFKLGRKAFKKKQYGDALVYYHMGYMLAPDLAGFLRELGSTYDKLGAKDKKLEFFRRYLYSHPFGKNADDIRKSVKKEPGVLGTLTLSTSLPCEQVYIQGSGAPMQLTEKLPVKKLALAPGRYGVLCFSSKYGLYYRDPVVVTADQDTTHAFNWAIVVNALENPYGRISIENPAGGMNDLGIDTPSHGVPCPDDGHALKLQLTDDAGTKSETRYQKLEPGQTYTIKW